MKNYIDEAGTFCWTPEGFSTFAGLTLSTRSLPAIEASFMDWKRRVLHLADADEVKGAALTREQLNAFASWVVVPHRDFRITVAGVDTHFTKEDIARTVIQQDAEVLEAVSRHCVTVGNNVAARFYRKMAV